MENSIVYIHTTNTVIDYITHLSKREMPDKKIFHILDETLLFDIKRGATTSAISKLNTIISGAQASGADRFMITCTSTGTLIDELDQKTQNQITRIEDAAIEKIKSQNKKVGVIYTNPTVWPEMQLILKRSGIDESTFAPCHVEGAFDSILSGNVANHDKLISDYLQLHNREYDSFLLAQVSICSAKERLNTLDTEKIISMAELGIHRLKEKYNA